MNPKLRGMKRTARWLASARRSRPLLVVGLLAALLLSCQEPDPTAPEAALARVWVLVLGDDGDVVPGADVTVRFLAPFDTTIVVGAFSGTTDASGEYRFDRSGAEGENVYSVDVAVVPPAGGPLAPRTVRASVHATWEHPGPLNQIEVQLQRADDALR
jgi:hypothetical protein